MFIIPWKEFWPDDSRCKKTRLPAVLGIHPDHRRPADRPWSRPHHRVPGSGLLIGTGIGFLGATFINPVERVDGVAVVQVSTPRSRSVFALTGIVFIIFGMGIVLALWPYIIAVLIILLGIMVLVHGFAKPYYVSLKK